MNLTLRVPAGWQKCHPLKKNCFLISNLITFSKVFTRIESSSKLSLISIFIYALSICPDKIFFVLDKKYFVLDKIMLTWTNLILSQKNNILSGQMDRALGSKMDIMKFAIFFDF